MKKESEFSYFKSIGELWEIPNHITHFFYHCSPVSKQKYFVYLFIWADTIFLLHAVLSLFKLLSLSLASHEFTTICLCLF